MEIIDGTSSGASMERCSCCPSCVSIKTCVSFMADGFPVSVVVFPVYFALIKAAKVKCRSNDASNMRMTM